MVISTSMTNNPNFSTCLLLFYITAEKEQEPKASIDNTRSSHGDGTFDAKGGGIVMMNTSISINNN